jgi:hypothetical protein
MYPPAANNRSELGAGQAPPPPGVASRVSDLQSVVSDTRELAFNLRGALGIANPPNDAAKNSTQASSLADTLTELRSKLIIANNDFRDVLQHLNS